MGKIARYFNELIVGNVFDAPEILDYYSTDRSIAQIKPKAVALPESTEDVSKLMRFCNQLAIKDIKVPVTIWGSGLDEMGADLGEGIIVSTEKLNRLLEADKRERLVRVQAGITLKELNTALSMYGLTIPIHGHENETVGGLISNCPSEILLKYVERIEVVLSNGDILQTNPLNLKTVERLSKERSSEGKIYRKISNLLKNHQELIDKIKQEKHGLAGYPMIAKISHKNSLDLMPLFFGAQGTLGVITEVILKATPIKNKSVRVVAAFRDFAVAQNFLDMANSLKPSRLEIYDLAIIQAAKNTGKKISAVNDRIEDGFVVFAKFDHRTKTCLRKVNHFKKSLPRTIQFMTESDKNKPALDEFENSLTSFLNQVRVGERVPIATNFYVPAENMVRFLDDLAVVERSLKMDLKLFGSYSSSIYSLRPKFDLEDEETAKKILAFLRASNFIINRQKGSLTGGTPEGRIKAIVTNNDLSEGEKNLYLEIKKIFDAREILNPDIKLGADAKFTVKHFRTTNSIKTVL
jgi:FAD/FMN-containing dehydrogenase